MGYYINPEGTSKEEWLLQHGTPISAAEALSHDPTGPSLPVCLVDNGAFTAAGIGYDPREIEAFAFPDGRRKSWYLVSKATLLQFAPSAPWEGKPAAVVRGRRRSE